MGCGSAKFTEDEDQFFKTPSTGELQSLCDDLLMGSVTKLIFRKRLQDAREDFVVKTADGVELLKCAAAPGMMQLYTTKGSFVCAIVFEVHYSEVIVVDAAYNLPQVYIYAQRPFREGQGPSEVKEAGTALYVWARLHKVSNIGTPKFELAFAEFQGREAEGDVGKFGNTCFASTLYPDGRMEIKRSGNGCCRVDYANEEKTNYAVSLAPWMDPALMLCTIMGMETLKGR